MKVLWSIEALARLEEIEDFISRDSPERGEKFVNRLIDHGESLGKNPLIG